ncbi:hypothetical protein EWB00_000095 [Schistosoma japonicum]|uniref:Nucleolar protein 14 n=1 Tax=Schistosoma japonicum TaxID=6182 RepID=A0A4Z2DKI6_SCHJA|nr:Nucleolar protein 14 [Schistosoma japonicum]TNN16888.1 hypothetical protein EWB00_000095 [Schistosoma japonicum]
MTKNSAKRHVCVKKSLHRIDISSLRKDLERYGKVGGLFDKRLSNRNFVQSESEVFLKRHIVEKLRQLDKVLLENIANDDPLFKAAFSNSSPTQLCTAYDVEGGIEGHIVDKVFFTNGPMTSKPVNNIRNFLLDKIAVEKLEKLKRVEENVEQRERLKIVDDEWSKTIRFLLTKVHNMKKRTKALTRQNHDGNVSRLLEELNADKKISPIDFDPTSGNSHNQFFRLQDMVSTLRPIVMANDHLVEKKTPISYLRILLRLPKEKFAAIAFISDQLRTARLRCLEDVIRYLFITQIAFEYCSESCKCLHNDTILYRNYIFCPEIVHALSRMFHLTSIGPNLQKNILVLRKSCINVEASDLPPLDVSLVNRSVSSSHNILPSLRLACVYRLIRLAAQVFLLYDNVLPKCVLTHLFRPLEMSLVNSNFLYHPAFIVDEVKSLSNAFKLNKNAPTPARLISDRRIFILNTLHSKDSDDFRKLSILPQLDPVFDERLCVNHDLNTKRILLRTVTKEKRCAMRNFRRDSQFLASHRLNIIKKSDYIREKKTKAILSSIRSLED